MSSFTAPATIKALQIQEDKTVKVVDLPFASQEKIQHLPADEILVRVRAVGLNPTDWKHAFGEWGTPLTISGCDAAGDVVAVGAGVTHLKVGDRVASMNFGGSWQKDNGAYAEFCRFKAAVSFALPAGMSYAEGASFPIPHLTAVQALYMRLRLPAPSAGPLREKILVWGGSTAVGHHAVQLAARSGLDVFVTASPAAHAELKALGAKHCFDYKDADVVAKIREAAGEDGIIYGLDTVVEHGSTDAVVDAMSAKRGGTVVTLLPFADATKTRRADVSAEFTLIYTALGYELTFGHVATFPAMPDDAARAQAYVSGELPKLLEGWKEGAGAPLLKTQKLRVLEGGLERIHEGFKIMQEGNYGREKLVYNIA